MGFSAKALVGVSMIAFGAGIAHAQTPTTVTSDEIVVTVQKREQALLTVPINVTALSGDRMSDLGITKFDDLARFVPGFVVQEQSANNTGFVIRGITSDSGEATVEPRIALFQDGVSAARNRGSYTELFDLERVEVAKGPQPTLFGRGALIGGVNVIQKKADAKEFSGFAEVAAGDYGYFRATGAANFPIVADKLGLRVAATHRQRDGFVANTQGGPALGGVDVVAGKVALRFDPTADLRFDLIFASHDDNNTGTPFKSGTFAPAGGSTSPFTPAGLNRTGQFILDGQEIGLKRSVRAGTLISAWAPSSAISVTGTTGYRVFDSKEVFDPDGFSYPVAIAAEEAAGQQWSQEIRVNYASGGRFSGFAGVSFMDERGRYRTPLQFDERTVLALVAGQITSPNPPPLAAFQLATPAAAVTTAQLSPTGLILNGLVGSSILASIPAVLPAATREALLVGALRNIETRLAPPHVDTQTQRTDTQSFDVFADGTFAVTPKLEVSAGVRWTQDDKSVSGSSAIPQGGSALGALLGAQALTAQAQAAAAAGNLALAGQLGAQASAIVGALTASAGATPAFGLFIQPNVGVQKKSDTFDGFTWRLVSRYAVSDTASLYASYARGRRPDVISPSAPSAPGGQGVFAIIPAETVDSVELGAKARLFNRTLSVDGSVFGYKYTNFQTTRFNGAQLVTVNDGDARAYGFEGQADWRPSARFDVFATYAYNHARLESGAVKGNRFRLSPDHAVSTGFTLKQPVTDELKLFVTPTYTWQSETYFDNENDKPNLQVRSPAAFSDLKRDEKQAGYGLLNVRAGVAAAENAWVVEAFVNNALDERYLLDAGNLGDSLGIPTFIRGPARTVGLELKGRF